MTAPDRIWTDRDTYWTHPTHKADKHEYILHTRAALAASPLVQEIVAEAVKAERDEAERMRTALTEIAVASFEKFKLTARATMTNGQTATACDGQYYCEAAPVEALVSIARTAIRARGEGQPQEKGE